MILKELKRSFKKNKLFSIVLVFQFCITFIFLNLCLNTVVSIQNQDQKFSSKLSNNIYFNLSNNLDSVDNFFENTQSLSNIKKFYNDVSKSDNSYVYFESIFQPLELIDFKGEDKFQYGYEDGFDLTENQFKLNNRHVTRVKNVLISENILTEFKLKLDSGRIFNKNDYDFSTDKTIPVILGYELKNIYSIGDNIEGHLYSDKAYKFKVVGFFEKDSFIFEEGNIKYLDRFIVTPAFNWGESPKTKEENGFQQILYFAKSTGAFIGLEDKKQFNSFMSEFNSVRQKHNIFDFIIVNMPLIGSDLLKIASKESVNISLVISSIMLFISIISLSITLICKIKSNLPTYGIYLLNGANKNNLITYISFEALTLFTISHIISYSLNLYIFAHFNSYSIYVVIASILPFIIGCIFSIRYLLKLSIGIDDILKEEL